MIFTVSNATHRTAITHVLMNVSSSVLNELSIVAGVRYIVVIVFPPVNISVDPGVARYVATGLNKQLWKGLFEPTSQRGMSYIVIILYFNLVRNEIQMRFFHNYNQILSSQQ